MNAVFCFVLGVYALLFVVFLVCMRSVWLSNRAATWPSARGVIESCKLEETSDGDGVTFYTVKVRYAYAVQDRRYTGDRLAIGYEGSGHRETQNAIVRQLQQAAAVDVRYDPERPESAVLSYGTHLSHQISLAYVLLIFLMLVGFTVVGWVSQKPDSGLLEHLVTHR
jgi:hypothetical protein